MKTLSTILLVIIFCRCWENPVNNVKELKGYKYSGYKLGATLNSSFVNKAFMFVKADDTAIINQKLPFDSDKKILFDKGIFYSCKLTKGTTYDLKLKEIGPESIPSAYISYYRTNAIFDVPADSSAYREIAKNTTYMYLGNYEKYIDMNSKLYEIVYLDPPTGCRFDH
jgi:hypothetical protein